MLLAPNPVVRTVSEYPLRKLPGGQEMLGIRLVPRTGYSLDTIRARFSEQRPDGVFQIQDISIDALGEAEVILPQEAWEVALEVSCTRRGLLYAPVPTRFLRSIHFETRVVRAAVSVEVPAGRKRQGSSRYQVPVADGGLTVAGRVGTAAENGGPARLAQLLRTRTAPVGSDTDEVVFSNDRHYAVSFVRRLVAQARSLALFIDPYFSFRDIRDFALSAWSGTCEVRVLTSPRAVWDKPLKHLATDQLHGELMRADLEAINRVRSRNGMSSVCVTVMRDPKFHDRFLVVDQAVWLFGNSFNSLGDGAVSIAVKIRDVTALRHMLLDASTTAEPFFDFWERTKPSGGED